MATKLATIKVYRNSLYIRKILTGLKLTSAIDIMKELVADVKSKLPDAVEIGNCDNIYLSTNSVVEAVLLLPKSFLDYSKEMRQPIEKTYNVSVM